MVNLLVADDHVVLREALCELLGKGGQFKVVAQASNGEEVVNLAGTHNPDIIIMDIAMPNVDGIEALKRLQAKGHCPPVLVLSANDGEMTVRAALKAGARGFLPKNVKEEELTFAIHAILKGQTYLSPSVTAHLMSFDSNKGTLDNPLAVLTKREIEILKYLAEGKNNREIGKTLHISVRTVDTHRSNILKKLKAKNNAELVRLALSAGLITL